jgi:protocatechuate 3,4-dioxygenase beta subunit
MNTMLKAVLLGFLTATLCLSQKKGSIAGSVVSVAGDPLKNATVTLLPRQPSRTSGAPAQQRPQPFSASTDAQGGYTFEDLDAGSYGVCSDKPGYLRNCAQHDSDLASGQTLTGVAIRMTPQAVISGKVTDEYGDPFQNTRVTAARWGYVGGHKQLQPFGGSASTNAEGVFAIGSLQAGSYYLQVTPQPVSVFPAAIQKGPEETFVTTYYPSVTDAASAIAVQVAAGGSMRGIDIRMHKARAYRIRGKLIGMTAPGSNIRLAPYGTQNGNVTSQVAADGGFDFEGVLSGIYVASWTSGISVARQVITVGNADVVDMEMQVGPGAEITGTISFDGPAPPQQQAQQSPVVGLFPTDGQAAFGSYDPQAKNDGTFAIHHIAPAVYRFYVQDLPPGTYIKSARFGGQDVLKAPFDLTGGSGGTVTIVLSPNAGDIGGIVHGADGMPRAGAMVTLWTPGAPVDGVTDLTRSLYTDANGQFKFASLPPGEYRLAAWEQYDPGLTLAPDFRIEFEDKAATVKLEESAHANIEAPLIARDAIEAAAAKLQ